MINDVFYDQREYNVYQQGFPIKRGEFYRRANFQFSFMIKFGEQANGGSAGDGQHVMSFGDVIGNSFVRLRKEEEGLFRLQVKYRDSENDTFTGVRLYESNFVQNQYYSAFENFGPAPRFGHFWRFSK